MDWYYTEKFKGGVIDILFEHAKSYKKGFYFKMGWKWRFKIGKFTKFYFWDIYKKKKRNLNMEYFLDWTPNDNSFYKCRWKL